MKETDDIRWLWDPVKFPRPKVMPSHVVVWVPEKDLDRPRFLHVFLIGVLGAMVVGVETTDSAAAAYAMTSGIVDAMLPPEIATRIVGEKFVLHSAYPVVSDP